MESCQARCRRAMERILSETPEDVIVVAHGRILVSVMDYLLRNQPKKADLITRNASISVIQYDRETGLGVLEVLNDCRHLKNLESGKTNKYC